MDVASNSAKQGPSCERLRVRGGLTQERDAEWPTLLFKRVRRDERCPGVAGRIDAQEAQQLPILVDPPQERPRGQLPERIVIDDDTPVRIQERAHPIVQEFGMLSSGGNWLAVHGRSATTFRCSTRCSICQACADCAE